MFSFIGDPLSQVKASVELFSRPKRQDLAYRHAVHVAPRMLPKAAPLGRPSMPMPSSQLVADWRAVLAVSFGGADRTRFFKSLCRCPEFLQIKP